MSDYFTELGHTPTGDNGPDDMDRNYRRLQVLAIMNGIDMDIEVPEASKRAIAKMPLHDITEDDVKNDVKCPVCLKPAEIAEQFKVLPCKHKYHEECILLWLKKTNSCPLCRYELETDDPVYEELRLYRQDEPNRRQRQDNLMDSMYS
ncbi:E3 ubiquitin-protein ligase RNF181 homolog [Teleopsis dalmanni]|uniref:E3 ubiquitin-protein ligase RNF181 homolog n=1 Tax=Teleopsis dalmanni TaxID=139649 RepID=UPI0018CED839|nr:E3 ubiquitin-protein ligase RNF181 homolog [Teleopsis dalmanni]XP_037952879.1 E3 ubiquitin-protein ligase RNF181 homolog [Teleopsis dalmanni]XP_037955643.1 E3 ubiquitin-protein ligase RNF181 homolog [Teleopsis dalmanni]